MHAAFAASLALGFGLTAAGGTQAFELTSPGYKPGDRVHSEQVFNDLGCMGGNLSPALAWKDPPKGTQSYLLTFYDPDAPSGSGWWHWVVYDIPADAKGLPAGVVHGKGLPIGAKEARTDVGVPSYGGPCAPPGETHRYVFTLTALKVRTLDVPADSTAAKIGYTAHFQALGTATLTLKFGRTKYTSICFDCSRCAGYLALSRPRQQSNERWIRGLALNPSAPHSALSGMLVVQ